MKITSPFLLCLLIMSCSAEKTTRLNTEKELIAVDKAFSAMSEQFGSDSAFTAYAHEEAVFLKPRHYPIEGKAKVLEYITANSGQGGKLTWEPVRAHASVTGDLGYTYGLYRWEADTVVSRGTYLSIWKKDDKGAWKYVLDTGNPGLGD